MLVTAITGHIRPRDPIGSPLTSNDWVYHGPAHRINQCNQSLVAQNKHHDGEGVMDTARNAGQYACQPASSSPGHDNPPLMAS